MKLTNCEIICAINFLKGILANFDSHKKEELILNFIENHHELMPYFEKSNVLSFALRNNEHTKQLTNLFLETNYSVDQDTISSFIACEYGHLKSTKLILDNGFNLNHEHNGQIIIDNLLGKINLSNSNRTLIKITKILNSINLDNLQHEKIIAISNSIIKAKINLLKMKTFNQNLVIPILDQFENFENNYKIINRKKTLDESLFCHNSITHKKTFKI